MSLSAPSWATRVGVSLVTLAIAGGLVVGTRRTTVDSTATHAVVDWQGTPPKDARCLWLTGLITGQAAHTFGLSTDGGQQYVYAHICGSPVDAGQEAVPPGMVGLVDTEAEEAFDGGPQLEAWAATDPAAPFPCACSSGSACQAPGLDGGLAAAPLGVTLQPGWVGVGCRPKSCIELAGASSWDSRCPLEGGP